jgi:hypothetical protein
LINYVYFFKKYLFFFAPQQSLQQLLKIEYLLNKYIKSFMNADDQKYDNEGRLIMFAPVLDPRFILDPRFAHEVQVQNGRLFIIDFDPYWQPVEPSFDGRYGSPKVVVSVARAA